MSQIKIYGLGGLGENGKNMQIVEVDNKIFILDCGSKNPSAELLGVESIVSNYNYILERKNDVVGLFLSHAHDNHIGGVPKLLSDLNVPIYGSRFTIELLKDTLSELDDDLNQFQFFVCDNNTLLTFDNIEIEFFSLTHSLPDTYGISIKTADGYLVYAPNYTFDQNVGEHHQTNFEKLIKFRQNGVLAFMGDSMGAASIGHTTTDYKLTHSLHQAIGKATGRVIIGCYSTELMHFSKTIKEALDLGKKIAIIGRKTQRAVDMTIKLGYISIPEDRLINLKYIDDTNTNEDSDLCVIVSGERHEPFFMIQRMCKKQDRLIHINSSDTVIMMTYPISGTEKIKSRTLDILSRIDTTIVKIKKELIPASHAASEDIKLMYTMLKPKYVVPICGDYRHQYLQSTIAYDMNYAKEDVIILDNGEILTINNGVLDENHALIDAGDILVDKNIEQDVNDILIRERELLSQEGFIMIIGNIDARNRNILNKPEIVSRGFVYAKNNIEFNENIIKIYNNVSNAELSTKYIDWKVYKEHLHSSISDYIFKETKRRPVIIPIILDTEIPRQDKN